MPLTQGAALGWLLLPRWGVWVNCDIIAIKNKVIERVR